MVTEPTAVIENEERSGATVTLKEVAARAGVSLGAASSVLSGGSNNIRVAPETQSRVLEAAQVLGYRSRRTATPRSKRETGATFASRSTDSKPLATITVGIITSFNPANERDGSAHYDPWEHDITAGLEIALNEGAAQVVTHYCNRGRPGNLPLSVEEAVAQMMAFRVDAIALIEISSSPQTIGRHIPPLMASKLPYVVVSTGVLAAPAANVSFDNFNAGYQAAHHLLEQGYSEIHFLNPVRAPWADERIAGVREALLHRNAPEKALQVFPDEEERAVLPPFDARVGRWDYLTAGLEIGTRYLERYATPPLAVIGVNDGTAVGFLTAAEARGFQTGVHYALMGFDDSAEARQHSLTTIRPPREAMGREAARLLLRLTAGDESARVQLRLNSHLMTRRSTPTRAALLIP